MPGEPLIRAENLELSYGDRTALVSSSFEIPSGSVTAVIGPNGAGKSTLLNAIAGLVEPTAGSLIMPPLGPGGVAYVLQSTKLNELTPITVHEAVGMGRYARLGFFHRFQPRDWSVCERAMERLGIGDLADRHLSELSGGQRQRVFVAQGLAQEASLLLLDEPITGLDLVSREYILEAIEAEKAAGNTVIGTTHSLEEAGMADHVILLAGRVVATGTPDDVLTAESLSAAYGHPMPTVVEGRVLHDDPHHRPANTRHIHFERKP
ncbi:putative siderophore transport system ATP-binding protein YusV [bacterium BMS3Abin02]|nr:putative siderophore transport system ATP-binding protein YusV [bacterium BMS3Abin02]HDL49386.1 metal ABC transporter ATP-binding protein [Actinomycetota bacterium]